jgi:hypothetical protein
MFSVCGVILVIQPYTLTWFYYANWTITDFSSVLFVILGYIISAKVSRCHGKLKVNLHIIISSLLFTLALGTYQPVINTIVVMLLARIIIDLFLDWDVSFNSLKNILLKHKYSIICVIGGAIIYYCVFLSLKANGKVIAEAYNLQTVSIENLFMHFIQVVKLSFSVFWTYRVAFFPAILIRLFAGIFIFAIIIAILNVPCQAAYWENEKYSDKQTKLRKCLKIGVIILSAALLIIFSKASAIISDNKGYQVAPRILFFGETFLHVFPIVLIFIQKFRFPKNITAVMCIVLINMCLIQDALALRIWKFGYEAEQNFSNKIAMTIEQNPSFRRDKVYQLIVIGEFPSYRSIYYYKIQRNEEKNVLNTVLLNMSYIPSWDDWSGAPVFFHPDIQIESLRYLYLGAKYTLPLSIKYRKEINRANVWPAKNSVIVTDDAIIIVFDHKNLIAVKKLIAGY